MLIRANLSKYYIASDKEAGWLEDELRIELNKTRFLARAFPTANLNRFHSYSSTLTSHNGDRGVLRHDADSSRNWQDSCSQRPEDPGHKAAGKFTRNLAVFFVPHPHPSHQLWSWRPALPWTVGTDTLHWRLQRSLVDFPPGHRLPESGNSCLTQLLSQQANSEKQLAQSSPAALCGDLWVWERSASPCGLRKLENPSFIA